MIGLQKLELVFKEYRQTDRVLRGQTGMDADIEFHRNQILPIYLHKARTVKKEKRGDKAISYPASAV